MSYTYELENGQQLVIENDGGETLVSLSSGSESQQQSQATGFDTGKWSKTPALFQLRKIWCCAWRLKTARSLFAWKQHPKHEERAGPSSSREAAAQEIGQSCRNDADEAIKRHVADETMKPLEPMKPMRPMKMRMGDTQMSIGRGAAEGESEQRFCPNCGKPMDKGDRFCGSCGKEVRQ
jgi:zinc-ribbon domain